jgi:hypothetical protein
MYRKELDFIHRNFKKGQYNRFANHPMTRWIGKKAKWFFGYSSKYNDCDLVWSLLFIYRDFEFEVNQRFIYSMSIEAETPEEAVKKAKNPEFDRSEADEDLMLESWDDLDTVKCVGERIESKDMSSSRLKRFRTPIR